MDIHIDARSLFATNAPSGVKNESAVTDIKNGGIKGDYRIRSTAGDLFIQKVKTPKKMASPAAIAKKIARGESVSPEELEYLRENNLRLFHSAMQAKRIRENLEQSLKSAVSDTAKATAIAEALSQASFLAAADAKSEDSSEITAIELYTDAIQAAIKEYGSTKLKEEMDDFINVSTSDAVEIPEEIITEGEDNKK